MVGDTFTAYPFARAGVGTVAAFQVRIDGTSLHGWSMYNLHQVGNQDGKKYLGVIPGDGLAAMLIGCDQAGAGGDGETSGGGTHPQSL